MHVTTDMVKFIQRCNVGHEMFEETGDGENGPNMSVSFVADEFQVYVKSETIVVCNEDGQFLVEFTINGDIEYATPDIVFIAPGIDVSHDECPFSNERSIFVINRNFVA